MKNAKRILLLLLAALLLLAGCSKKEDTRKYIQCIGVVVTNDTGSVFDEMYIYPSSNTGNDKGVNLLPKSRTETRVGSYGATLEISPAYNIIVRDRDGGVYEFDQVSLSNADEAVISYTDALYVTLHHRNGGSDVVMGEYVNPGDAPSRPYEKPLKKVNYAFDVVNNTSKALTRITMREAGDIQKGEVELYLKEVPAGQAAAIRELLYEDDMEITEWVLDVTTADGESTIIDGTFNPWTAKTIVLQEDGGTLTMAVVEDETASTTPAASEAPESAAGSAPADAASGSESASA